MFTRDDLDAALARYPEGDAGRVILARAVTQVALHARHAVRVYLGTSGYLTDLMQRFRAEERDRQVLALVAGHVHDLAHSRHYHGPCILDGAERCAMLALVDSARVLLHLSVGRDETARALLTRVVISVGAAAAAAADACERRGVPDRADAEQMRHDLPAFLDATGGAEGPWCVRYDAETGPVRVPVRAEIKTAALERASGTGAHDHARGDVCPGEDPGAPTNAATEGTC